MILSLQAVLEHLRDFSKDQLKNLLVNWYRRAKGKYKVPVFAHQELDLHKVFWEVQDRGGYDHVTAHKLWKASSRILPCLRLCFSWVALLLLSESPLICAAPELS